MRTAIEQARENYRINEERYKEQVATSTDVLNAQTLLSKTMTNYYNALYDFKARQGQPLPGHGKGIRRVMDTPEKDAIIRMFRVSKQYGAKVALSEISLDVYKNDFVFITGPSGAGKSTLLKMLYLGEPVTRGQVLVDGMNLTRIRNHRIPFPAQKMRHHLPGLQTDPHQKRFRQRGPGAGGRPERIAASSKKRCALSCGPWGWRTAGPICRRASPAASSSGWPWPGPWWATPRSFLPMSPPAASILNRADIIFELLKRFHNRGGTLIIATHDKDMIQRIPARLIRLRQGLMQPETQSASRDRFMMIYLRKAFGDISDNRFLTAVTVVTIALSILISSIFALFVVNTNALMDSWKSGLRLMAYLRPHGDAVRTGRYRFGHPGNLRGG